MEPFMPNIAPFLLWFVIAFAPCFLGALIYGAMTTRVLFRWSVSSGGSGRSTMSRAVRSKSYGLQDRRCCGRYTLLPRGRRPVAADHRLAARFSLLLV